MQVQVQHAANLVATYRASHSFWALDRVSKLKQLIPAQKGILSAKRVVLIYLQQAWQIPWCGCDHILNDEGTLPNAQMLATLLLTETYMTGYRKATFILQGATLKISAATVWVCGLSCGYIMSVYL